MLPVGIGLGAAVNNVFCAFPGPQNAAGTVMISHRNERDGSHRRAVLSVVSGLGDSDPSPVKLADGAMLAGIDAQNVSHLR
jgi:hypothetical protein